MYFPTLNTLKSFKIDGNKVDDFFIKKLDLWLGTRRKAVKKFLSPIQFSLDTGIDEDVSIDLFFLSTEKKVEVLLQRFVIECPNCNSILGSFHYPNEIPEKIFCSECNQFISVTEEMIAIYFELIQLPNLPKLPQKHLNGSGGKVGKDTGLRTDKLTRSNSSTARRLTQGLNERFRSS